MFNKLKDKNVLKEGKIYEYESKDGLSTDLSRFQIGPIPSDSKNYGLEMSTNILTNSGNEIGYSPRSYPKKSI